MHRLRNLAKITGIASTLLISNCLCDAKQT